MILFCLQSFFVEAEFRISKCKKDCISNIIFLKTMWLLSDKHEISMHISIGFCDKLLQWR